MIQAKKSMVILVLAFVGWAACAAIIGIGMSVTSELNALTLHAIGAPIVFALVSLLYFRRFRYTTPIQTAAIFVAFVILMDFFVVSIAVLRSFEMFTSLLGTWIPFALIFLSTCLTGLYTTKRTR